MTGAGTTRGFLLAIAILAPCLLWMRSGTTQEPPKMAPVRAGVVDLVHIFDSYKRLSDWKSQIVEKGKEKFGEVQQIRDEIKALNEKIENIKDYNSPTRRRYEQQLELNQARIEYMREVFQSDHEKKFSMAMTSVFVEVLNLLDDLSDKYGLEIVMRRDLDPVSSQVPVEMIRQQIISRPVLYSRNQLDLTDEVLELLHANYEKRLAAGDEPDYTVVPEGHTFRGVGGEKKEGE